MSCTVAVGNSPVFSPSRVSIFCKSTTVSSSSSPDSISLHHHHHHHHHHGSSSLASSPCGGSSGGGSPFRLRLQKSPISGLRVCSKDEFGSTSSGFDSASSISASASSASTSTSAALLKRKRPARIDIPVASLSFAVPEMSVMEEMEVERDGYSVYCKKGRREAMEDRYSAVVDLQGDSKQAFFGVFDGHGGAKAAEFAAENLEKNIMNEVTSRRGEEIVEAVKNGYLSTDSEFLKEDVRGGTCCVTALIRNGDLIVSNAGDCRAVMSRGGIAEALTSDHRPSREDEKERIETKGGYVDFCHGVWRLQGSLAVSRGIGDRHLKEWVIAEPETKILKIKPDCEFLVLASDGLWDKVTNQEAVDIARPLCVDVVKPTPFLACKKLAELAVTRGSVDDISVMVIQLEKFA